MRVVDITNLSNIKQIKRVVVDFIDGGSVTTVLKELSTTFGLYEVETVDIKKDTLYLVVK